MPGGGRMPKRQGEAATEPAVLDHGGDEPAEGRSVPLPRQRGGQDVVSPGLPVEPVDAGVLPLPMPATAPLALRLPSLSAALRMCGLHLEAGAAFLAGAVTAFVGSDLQPDIALLALAVWLVAAYHGGRAATTALNRQFRTLLESAMLPMVAIALAVAFAGVNPGALRESALTVGTAAIAASAFRFLRWRWHGPVRTVVVGDRSAVAQAFTRWASQRTVHVVGAVVLSSADGDRGEAAPAPPDICGVPVIPELSSLSPFVLDAGVDLVLVEPGPAVTAPVFRRLTWALEECGVVAVGVSGILDTVSPRRMAPGSLGDVGVLSVRPPRPSTVVRGVKAALDRVLGLVLLIATSPLLALLALAVRIDSRGPAFFAQTRAGRDGRRFTMYKLRTMVVEAEQLKDHLSPFNEFDDVLFKIARDPRVTRLGSFLRRSSLDELPQLWNVVRGEMSLVGPRPYIPEEIAKMDPDSLRRQAVQPGLTGLWQISGRSDLEWEQSKALDTYYADNWSLGADAKIAARTVKAVIRRTGAY